MTLADLAHEGGYLGMSEGAGEADDGGIRCPAVTLLHLGDRRDPGGEVVGEVGDGDRGLRIIELMQPEFVGVGGGVLCHLEVRRRRAARARRILLLLALCRTAHVLTGEWWDACGLPCFVCRRDPSGE